MVGEQQVVPCKAIFAGGLEEHSEPPHAIYSGKRRDVGRPYVGGNMLCKEIRNEKPEYRSSQRGYCGQGREKIIVRSV